MAQVEYFRLLSLSDIDEYLSNINTDVRQNIITRAMMSTVMVHKKDIYFMDVVNRYFKKISEYAPANLSSLITQFVGVSLTVLQREDSAGLKRIGSKSPKEFAKLQAYKPSDVGSFKMKLSLPEELMLNNDLGGIHFINGRFDLHSKTFGPRLLPSLADPKTLISEVLPYEWQASSAEEVAAFLLILSRLFADSGELNYVLFVVGGALRGDVSGCSCMFHVGKGKNGKTALLRFIAAALPIYSQELPSHVFDSRVVANRVLSEVRLTSRFLIVHELNKNTKDASVIKSVCDGQIVTTKMYKGGAFTIPIHGKLFCTTNNIIAFDDDDGGIARRIQYCIHANTFTENAHEVDNVRVFPAVKFNYDNLTVNEKLSVFNLIAHYAADEFVSTIAANPELPASIRTCDTIMNISAFLGTYYVNEPDVYVSKDVVFGHAKQFFADMEYSDELLIGKICKLVVPVMILYDKKRTVDGCKGAFVNMRLI